MIFFTSDSHFCHADVILFCNRPFYCAEEMDDALIDRWNAVVGKEDTVWHLGDFSLLTDQSQINDLLEKLNGHKHLVMGNHDTVYGVTGWDSVHRDAVMLRESTSDGKSHNFYLQHYPLRGWPGMSDMRTMHLYGHVHGEMQPQPGSMDVGVDTWGGAPVSIDQVVAAIQPFSVHSQETFMLRQW